MRSRTNTAADEYFGGGSSARGLLKFGSFKYLVGSASACVYLWLIFLSVPAPAQNGKDAKWESAGKQAVGTSATAESKIWFTLQGGSLTEVFYPTADQANVQ